MGSQQTNGEFELTDQKRKYETIVVGGGIAGLTAAVYQARAGRDVLLIEKNDEFGGLVSTFEVDGFHFEAGVRALESAGVILPMLEDLDIHLDMVKSHVSVGIEDKIIGIEGLESIQDYRNMLVDIFPNSETEIDAFIRDMRKIMRHVDILYGIENPLFKNLKRDYSYILRKLLPWLPRFLFTIGKINRLNCPVEAYLEKRISDPSLRDMIAQHFFKGTPTFFALSYFSLYLDYFYPKGGVGTLAEALADKIKSFGGALLPNTAIGQIMVSENTILDGEGNRFEYKNLIWACDLRTMYTIAETNGLDPERTLAFEARKLEMMQARGSESVFSLYLQVDLPLSYFDAIAHGHFFYTPEKKGLGEIHRSELKDILSNWESTRKEKVWDWLDRFIKYNTFEISIPGIKDPSLVPEGKTGLIVSFIIEYELFQKLEASGWYAEFRKEVEQKMIRRLSTSIYPELEAKIMKQFSFTPLSIKSRISSTDGSIVGWSFEERIPVPHKITHSGKSADTPIPNIMVAGQWSFSPAGVPMAILTGKIASDACLKKK